MNSNTIKTTFIGQSTTGKTTIVHRMKYETFLGQSACTVGVNFMKISFNGINYELWDTAGQERYFALSAMYFRNSKIIVFVFDVLSPESLNAIDMFIPELNKLSNYKLIIIGNKTDLLSDNEIKNIDEITTEKLKNCSIADNIYAYISLSAKTGVNFDTFIEKLNKCAMEINNIPNPDDYDIVRLDIPDPVDNRWCAC